MISNLLNLDQLGPFHFVGRRRPGGTGRIYGGQVFAQAMMAATRTVDPSRPIHSMHAYFLRGGNENYEIDLEVAADFDGGSFSNRRATGGFSELDEDVHACIVGHPGLGQKSTKDGRPQFLSRTPKAVV